MSAYLLGVASFVCFVWATTDDKLGPWVGFAACVISCAVVVSS